MHDVMNRSDLDSRYGKPRITLTDPVRSRVERVTSLGYDKQLDDELNRWAMHARASKAEHLRFGPDGCEKCRRCLGRIEDTLDDLESILDVLGSDPARLLGAQPFPSDIEQALRHLRGSEAADGSLPSRAQIVASDTDFAGADNLSLDQRRAVERWIGHGANLRAEHLNPNAIACGGCEYLAAELRAAFDIKIDDTEED